MAFVKSVATLTTTVEANTDVGGAGGGGNLDIQVHDLTIVAFDKHRIFLNSKRLQGQVAAGDDYSPGSDLSLGQLRFGFRLFRTDVLCIESEISSEGFEGIEGLVEAVRIEGEVQ